MILSQRDTSRTSARFQAELPDLPDLAFVLSGATFNHDVRSALFSTVNHAGGGAELRPLLAVRVAESHEYSKPFCRRTPHGSRSGSETGLYQTVYTDTLYRSIPLNTSTQ
jgi:hypothetical protein